jgi:pantoate--beta-alanine ligase
MRVIETIAELRHQIDSARKRGERVGFVPTMGALHDGHQALMRVAHAQCDFVVASVYVNPTQFAPGEDFDRYPRTLDADRLVAEAAGVDLLWCPTDDEMYGPPNLHGVRPGFATRISVGDLGTRLCGEFRPGHFDGVATVVAKMLGAVQPDVLYLGEKDYQQAVVLRQVVRDLLLPVEVRTVPTVRDVDELALSSRNRFLTAEQRAAALAVPRALEAVEQAVRNGERSIGRLRARAEITLAEEPLVQPQYVEFVDPETLEPQDAVDGDVMALIAVHVGDTRLIDNRRLSPVAAETSSTAQAMPTG